MIPKVTSPHDAEQEQDEEEGDTNRQYEQGRQEMNMTKVYKIADDDL
jgi:hypothetical protein